MIQFFIFVQIFGFVAASAGFSRYGQAGNGYNYGYGAARDHHGFDDSSRLAHGNDRAWSHAKNDESSDFDSAKFSSHGNHDTGAHHQDFSSNFDNKMSDYGRNLKTKSYGFFDYRYVRPQYHIEQFHSDEKYSNKHASDTFSSGGRQSERGGYHDRGHDSYEKEHDSHGDHKSSFESSEEEQGFKGSDYNRNYGHDDASRFDHGYHGHSKEYGERYLPQYVGQYYNHGYPMPTYRYGRYAHY
ncbi:hypothetical protein Aduo_019690 [Ancylostoma duodenale]